MISDSCIVIPIRYPEKGSVKTLLANDIGENGAMMLYRCFVADVLEATSGVKVPVIVYVEPKDKLAECQEWLGEEYRYITQEEEDTSDRIKRVFEDMFDEGMGRVVMIKSDLPNIYGRLIEQAFDLLQGPADSIIGPDGDGGYYMIGFCRDGFTSDVFENIPWGSSNVWFELMERFSSSGHHVEVLPECRDVDTVDDLKIALKDIWCGVHTKNAVRNLELLQ